MKVMNMIFDITNEDITKVIESLVLSKNPIVIKTIPAKEKRKFIILCMIIHLFESNKVYSEKEVNDVLRDVVLDYVLIRRYLIDYKFLSRTTDGKEYWLNINKEDYIRFKL